MEPFECPQCGEFAYKVNVITFIGTCGKCGFLEKIDKDTWNLKYDDGYKELRDMLKYNNGKREHLIKYFELDKPDSFHAKYLLTPDVLEVLKKESPEIYHRLP